MKLRYPSQMAKSILKQSLQGLVFLHRNNIAHGDFQPGNMLFPLKDIDDISQDVLRQEKTVETQSTSPPVERLDACFLDDPPKKPFTPAGLRTPELVLSGGVDRSLDIWSFGFLVFELVTGQQLFCVPWYDSDTDRDDDHIMAFHSRLGPLPEGLYRQWATSSHYFILDRELYNCHLGGIPDGEEALMLEQMTMEEAFDQAKLDFSKEEAIQAKKLIRWIL
ncbi:hypothetical protein ACHAPU_006166 [Fusarium lateritium]